MNNDIQCSAHKVKEELASFVAAVGAGVLGTYLFTTLNPAAGLVFGATFYFTSLAIRSLATKMFGELGPFQTAACDFVAGCTAVGISCGVLLAASIVITPASMAVVAVSTLVAYVLVKIAIVVVNEYGCKGLCCVGLCCLSCLGNAGANRAAHQL